MHLCTPHYTPKMEVAAYIILKSTGQQQQQKKNISNKGIGDYFAENLVQLRCEVAFSAKDITGQTDPKEQKQTVHCHW